MRIYHIASPAEWEAARLKGVYEAASLATEGFIHCSFDDQISGVFDRYYRGAGKLLVLEIDPELLKSELRIEPSTGGEEYPHIYGPINTEAVVGTALVAAPE